jgi:spermidine synthase
VSRRPLLILFFASGAAALIYELVWFHLVTLVVGASALSVAAILASFMGGMAIGSALVPRVTSPSTHPLRLIATLEAGIAAIGLAMPFLLPLVRDSYVAVAAMGYPGVLLRMVVSALVLLPPTILMGATLPVVSRWVGASRDGRSDVGLLYMANIAGGASGTLLAGFYLLRVHDVVVASLVAVAINLFAASLAWLLSKRYAYAPVGETADSDSGDAVPFGASVSSGAFDPFRALASERSVYLVAALSGLTALGAEVVWTRQLSLLFGASVYTFSLILAVFLTGLGIGSYAGSTLGRRVGSPMTALGVCQLLLVLAIAYASRAIVDWLPAWQPTNTYLPNVKSQNDLRFAFDALRTAVALLPSTILWGASFPLALAAAQSARDAARIVGRINATNTMGSLTGALAFTLLVVPLVGSQHAQQGLAGLAAIGAAAALWVAAPGARRLVGVAACAVIAVLAAVIVPPVPGRLIAFGRSVDSYSSIKQILYLREGATASVAVTENTAGAHQFHISGKVEASDMDIDMRLERMLGHVPALMHPNPETILVVGVGAGVTAGSFVVHPEVKRIVICEIEPVVPASARAYFGAENHHVFDDPRVELVYDDARHFLETTNEKFDIITTDPIHPWVRGAATLYSEEYLQIARRHLKPGGVFTQWVPLYETDEASVKSEIATFVEAFPETTLWNPDLLEEGYDLVAMGRLERRPISEADIAHRLATAPALQQSLRAVTLGSAANVLSTYAGRGQDLAPWLKGAAINRERKMPLQYLAGMAANSDSRYAIFQGILQYRRYPTDLFSATEETEASLRKWYLPN